MLGCGCPSGGVLPIPQVLESEFLGGWLAGGMTVVICGPPRMCDEVRMAVVALAKRDTVVHLAEKVFSGSVLLSYCYSSGDTALT